MMRFTSVCIGYGALSERASYVCVKCGPSTPPRQGLGRYFNTSARFWMNAQSSYDLEVAQDELQRTIERDVRPLVA